MCARARARVKSSLVPCSMNSCNSRSQARLWSTFFRLLELISFTLELLATFEHLIFPLAHRPDGRTDSPVPLPLKPGRFIFNIFHWRCDHCGLRSPPVKTAGNDIPPSANGSLTLLLLLLLRSLRSGISSLPPSLSFFSFPLGPPHLSPHPPFFPYTGHTYIYADVWMPVKGKNGRSEKGRLNPSLSSRESRPRRCFSSLAMPNLCRTDIGGARVREQNELFHVSHSSSLPLSLSLSSINGIIFRLACQLFYQRSNRFFPISIDYEEKMLVVGCNNKLIVT